MMVKQEKHMKPSSKANRIVLLPLLAAAVVLGSCGPATFIPPDYIPPEYYQCTEIDPQDLINVYFSGYGDFTTIEALYNDVVYVFKNVPVDKRMVMALDEGYIWVDQVKAYLVNPESMNRFKFGDMIDLVGINDGPTSYYQAGLTFIECYALPAGEIPLPLDQGEGTPAFTPGY